MECRDSGDWGRPREIIEALGDCVCANEMADTFWLSVSYILSGPIVELRDRVESASVKGVTRY